MSSEFDYRSMDLAHPAKRVQGQFLDGAVAVGLFFLFVFVFNIVGWDNPITGFVKIAVPVCYFVFADALPGGQSLGKKPFGFHVVSKSTGKPCTIIQSFLRNAFSPLLGLIDAVVIFGKNHQRLGDKFANTIVVRK